MLQTHLPAGASLKQFFHYGQLIRSNRFRQFDYGTQRNYKIYGQRTPPDYNLKNCKASVALIYADDDSMAAAEDVKRLPNEMPNVIEIRRVDDDTFNHVDFIWATDAKELVYDHIIDWMRTAEMKGNDNESINEADSENQTSD